jgi:hypothetical protein
VVVWEGEEEHAMELERYIPYLRVGFEGDLTIHQPIHQQRVVPLYVTRSND